MHANYMLCFKATVPYKLSNNEWEETIQRILTKGVVVESKTIASGKVLVAL